MSASATPNVMTAGSAITSQPTPMSQRPAATRSRRPSVGGTGGVYQLADALPIETQLHLAVLAYSPGEVAVHFARMVGQFSGRQTFDAFACRTRGLYARMDPKLARRFAIVLDERLRQRDEPPVSWGAE